MKSILYVGMDVHKNHFTLCTFMMGDEKGRYKHRIASDYKLVLRYIDRVQTVIEEENGEVEVICGYEAGCLGYSLYRKLTKHHVKCVILAPTTIPKSRRDKKQKNDKRDAESVAKAMAHRTGKVIHIPTEEDEGVKEYIRMRNDHKKALKRIKQQILSLCLRHGLRCASNNWSKPHRKWLMTLELKCMDRETLDEYLITLSMLEDRVKRMDLRIAEIAEQPQYKESVKKLTCFRGVGVHTAMCALAEISDFNRFATAEKFAAYLGLVPGEFSSGDKQKRLGITKAGNSHVRRLLIQSAHSIAVGKINAKSRELQKRQEGNRPIDIAYADRANERLRRKHYRLKNRGVKYNVGVTAIARELACFMWGMMTGHVA